MSYKRAKITIEFCKSGFVQYEKSTVSTEYDFQYGNTAEEKMLDDHDRLLFLRLARDKVQSAVEDEIERQSKGPTL